MSAKLYAPLHEHEAYRSVLFNRDLAYGPTSRNMLDIARPRSADKQLRPVLIFVSGGAGNRIEVPGYLFYDNVLLWAVANGFVSINMQRDAGPDIGWDAGARNIAAVIAWTRAHAKQYGGDFTRIYVWGHSTGATMLATYLSHPEYFGPQGSGVRGAILHSGAYNIAPLKATKPGRPNPQAVQDPALLLARSSLPGLQQTSVPLLLVATDGDPQDRPEYVMLLNAALCQAGHCPSTLLIKDHDHMGEIFSINTPDTAVSAPILEWLRRVNRH